MSHGFRTTSSGDLDTIRATLMTEESVEAFSRLEFELKAWRLHKTVLLERLNQINDGIVHSGHLYIKFESAVEALTGECVF